MFFESTHILTYTHCLHLFLFLAHDKHTSINMYDIQYVLSTYLQDYPTLMRVDITRNFLGRDACSLRKEIERVQLKMVDTQEALKIVAAK